MSFARTAQCRAVVPSGSAALGLAFKSSSSIANLVLPAFAAATNRESFSPAAKATVPAISNVNKETRAFMFVTLRVRQTAAGIPELVDLHANLVQHRQQQVGHRRVIFVMQVASALQPAHASAREKI